MKKSFLFLLFLAIAFLSSCNVSQPMEKLQSINEKGELVLETGNLSAYLAYLEGDTVTKYAKLDSSNKDLGLTVNGNDITFRTMEEVTVVLGTTEHMNLTIDAPNAEIVHYGKANAVNLKAVKDNTYQGKAAAVSLRIEKGHVELQAPVGSLQIEASSDVIMDVLDGGTVEVVKVFSRKGGEAVKINVCGNGSLETIDANTDMALSIAPEATVASISISSGSLVLKGSVDKAVVSPEAKNVHLVMEEGTVLSMLDIQGSAVLSGEGTVTSVEVKGSMEVAGATLGEVLAIDNAVEITVTSGSIEDLKAENTVSGFTLLGDSSLVKGSSLEEGVLLKNEKEEEVLLHKHSFLKDASLSKEPTEKEEGYLVELCSCGCRRTTIVPAISKPQTFDPEILILGDWKEEAYNEIFTFCPDKTGFCINIGEEEIETFTYTIDEEKIYLTVDQMTMGIGYLYHEDTKSVTIYDPEGVAQGALVQISTTPSKKPTPKPTYNPQEAISGDWRDMYGNTIYTFRTNKTGFISYPDVGDLETFTYRFERGQLIISMNHGTFTFDYQHWSANDSIDLTETREGLSIHLVKLSQTASREPVVQDGPTIPEACVIGEWRSVLGEVDGVVAEAGVTIQEDGAATVTTYLGDECINAEDCNYSLRGNILTFFTPNHFDQMKFQYTGETLIYITFEPMVFTKLFRAE